MNSLKVTILMVAMLALFAAVGYLIGGQGGMLIALVIAMGLNFFSYWFSDKLVLKMYKAREISEADHPRLFTAVRRVSQKAMIPMPRVYIVPSKAPNAFATGRNPENAAVAATEGLLELLNQDELEGVMAHEIAHVRNRDMLIGTVAATLAGAIGIIASIARWGAIFGGFSRDDRGGGIGLLVAAIIAPLMAILIQTAISRQREYKADSTSGEITGKPMALASALKKLHTAPVRLNLDQRPATAHLMIANPLSGRGMASLFSTHPPVEKRIENLQKLARNSAHGSYVR
ncbi:zinc metalloprotease HtpX [candidate division GN15 bacterium]|nr:zinc metalloprotease HtpX [candidate division GN15 bacterium]